MVASILVSQEREGTTSTAPLEAEDTARNVHGRFSFRWKRTGKSHEEAGGWWRGLEELDAVSPLSFVMAGANVL